MIIKSRYAIFIFFIILGGITFGYNISVIASALPQIKTEFLVSDKIVSLIAGLVFAGMVSAKLFMSVLNDTYGRRKTLLIAGLIFIVGTLSIVLSNSVYSIMVGRSLQGFGGGLLMFTTSLYITEVAADDKRGKLMSLYQLSFTIGILLANVIGMFVYNISWRLSFDVLILMTLVFMVVVYILPCSPKWLYLKGMYDNARVALMINHDVSEIDKIFVSWRQTSIANNSDRLLQKRYIKPLLLVIIITCLHQLTGINAILQTSTIIMSQAGLVSQAALLSSIGITLMNVIGTLIGFYFIEIFPRNKMLGICGITIAFAHLIIALNYFVGINSPVILIGGLTLFILAYAIGPGIIIWLVFSEYLPTPVRSKGLAISAFINSLAGFVIASLFLDISKHYGFSWLFLMCFIFSLIYGIIPLIYLPNTNSRDIEDFEGIFNSKKNIKY